MTKALLRVSMSIAASYCFEVAYEHARHEKIGKVIAYIVLLLVVIFIGVFIAYFTGGFTSDFKTFYVSINGKDSVLSYASGYEMTTDTPINVEVKYTFGQANKDIKGYSVKVIPNVITGKDFDFTIDDSVYSYQAESDLTAGFVIDYAETSFTIRPKGGIVEILSAVYPRYEIGDCRSGAYNDMYAMVVTSYNGAASVTICFSVTEKLAGVTLDLEVIEF